MHASVNYDYIDVMFLDFNKMVKALGSLESMKGDFIANVSHEFKTPLSVIQSYASALQNPNMTDEQRAENIATIINSTQKLSSMVSNILKLNQIENQIIQLTSEPYDLCRQLGECAIAFEEKWSEKDIDLEAEMNDCATIYADASMLEIVWHNLISNAIKFTEHGGTVGIWQFSEEDSVTVAISDNGCGMDKRTQERVFEKFYQGDTSHSTEGNGPGLALVSKIVNLAGGTLTLESEVGHGSTFTVRLPVNT